MTAICEDFKVVYLFENLQKCKDKGHRDELSLRVLIMMHKSENWGDLEVLPLSIQNNRLKKE